MFPPDIRNRHVEGLAEGLLSNFEHGRFLHSHQQNVSKGATFPTGSARLLHLCITVASSGAAVSHVSLGKEKVGHGLPLSEANLVTSEILCGCIKGTPAAGPGSIRPKSCVGGREGLRRPSQRKGRRAGPPGRSRPSTPLTLTSLDIFPGNRSPGR